LWGAPVVEITVLAANLLLMAWKLFLARRIPIGNKFSKKIAVKGSRGHLETDNYLRVG